MRAVSATLRGALLLGLLGLSACSSAEGTGRVVSDSLFLESCWNGRFDLKPDFFAANTYQDQDSLLIRIQRGDDFGEFSDGVSLVVNDVTGIRQGLLNQPLPVGMPPAVVPPGYTVTYNANPPKVTLSLYLHNSCASRLGTLYSVSGTITFRALFSGNPNESHAEDRLTDADFDATFADPRELDANGKQIKGQSSHVTGSFRFYFQRGQPAQPFP